MYPWHVSIKIQQARPTIRLSWNCIVKQQWVGTIQFFYKNKTTPYVYARNIRICVSYIKVSFIFNLGMFRKVKTDCTANGSGFLLNT